MGMTRFLGVSNRKGGVGKSTISIMLAHAAAAWGQQRVLVMDLDTQCNASLMLIGGEGWEVASRAGRTIADYFYDRFDKVAEEHPRLGQQFLQAAGGGFVLLLLLRTGGLLAKDQEQHLFRQMNYLKYQAAKARARLDPARAKTELIEGVEHLLAEAAKVKDLLLRCNMRLVVSIAKKRAGQAENFFELLSDGNLSLIRAVEKFDFGRGYKFSTYASWAIMKNFSRSIPEERRRRERYQTGHEDYFATTADTRTNEQECVARQEQSKHRVNRLLDYLDPRERQIVRMRAGLDSHEGMTLEEIGAELGITKERVRQLNVRIMHKLRTIAREQRLDSL